MAKFHGRHTRIYMDGFDISGDLNSLEPNHVADTAEVSGFGAVSKSYVVGLLDTAIRFGGLFNDAPNKAHGLATARIGSEVMFNASWGTDQGKFGFGGTVNLDEYSVSSPIGGAVTISGGLSGAGANGVFEFARTLHGNSPFQASPSGFDTGETPGNAGFSGHLQLLGGSGTVIIQSSTAVAGPTWVDRIDFGSHASPYAAYVGTYNGTAPQFLRANYVGAAGTGFVAYARF